MKKYTRILSLTLLLAALTATAAFAASYYSTVRVQAISSVRLTIDTGSLNTGDELSDNAFSYVSIPDNEYYDLIEAEWLDVVDHLQVGDAPRMKVYLAARPREIDYNNYTKLWLFQGGYTDSNVHVAKGTFISSSIRDSGYILEITLRINPAKGAYNAPQSAYWDAERGIARWNAAEFGGSGLYDIYCYRNGSVVKKLFEYQGTFYNFFPYMTKEGDYTFRVRCAVPSDMAGQGGKTSEWTESGGLYIHAEQVSDGTGQTTADEKGGSSSHQQGNTSFPNGTGTENVAGWVRDATGTYFRYPNGQYAGAGWLKMNGSWYYLDSKGKQLHGWQIDPRTGWYYFMDKETGIMKTGWLYDNNHWYYLDTQGGSYEGRMMTGWVDLGGSRYYFNGSGIMVTGWYEIDGKWYYFYPQGSRTDGKYGFMAQNTQIGDFRIGADGTWSN